MHLNHIDIPVADVTETRRFFETLLGFRHIETKGRDALAILDDGAGLLLVLSKTREGDAHGLPERFHIGFHLETEAHVRDAHERFAAAGVDALSTPAVMRGGLTFYCRAPSGLLVEIASRPRA
jgi:catechol 2,3-dioxygenase-like lactoylglutathione lyase family enzyme